MQSPVAKDWNILLGVTEQVFSYDDDSATSRTQVFLSTGEDNSELVPSNWFGTNVGAEVSDDDLILWNHVPWERVLVKSEAVDCFVGAEVEEGGIWVDVPLVVRYTLGTVIVSPGVGYEVDGTMFLHFIVVLV